MIKIIHDRKYTINLIALSFLIAFALTEASFLITLSTMILGLQIMLNNEIEDFYSFLSFTPFFLYLTNSNALTKYLFFTLIAVSVLKLLRRGFKNRHNGIILVSIVALLLIEIINDIVIGKLVESLSIILFMIYFSFFILTVDVKNYDHMRALKYFVTGLMIALIVILITNPLHQMMDITRVIRLGDGIRLLGGAMGVPIYSLLVVSLLSTYLITHRPRKYISLLLYSCVGFSFLIGFLSISRSYILGLLIIAIGFAFSLLAKHGRRVFIFLGIGIVFIRTFLYMNPNLVGNLFYRYSLRKSVSSLDDIRIDIYRSIFEYMCNNPKPLFFGLGARNYTEIGESGGYLFSMMAHNLYLDALISWGIIGTLFLINITFYLVKKCRRTGGKVSILSLTPAFMMAALYMTEGTFNYFNVYIYIIFLIFNSFYLSFEKVRT